MSSSWPSLKQTRHYYLRNLQRTHRIWRRSRALRPFAEGGIKGTTRFLKNITGMWLLERCRKVWKAEGKDYSYAELQAMALAEKDFPGRIDPDDARFANPENMVEEILRSAQDDNGVMLNEVKHLSDAQIVSCIYHSLAERYREVLQMLQGFAPFRIDKLHIIGGSTNGLLNQWTADAIGIYRHHGFLSVPGLDFKLPLSFLPATAYKSKPLQLRRLQQSVSRKYHVSTPVQEVE